LGKNKETDALLKTMSAEVIPKDLPMKKKQKWALAQNSLLKESKKNFEEDPVLAENIQKW
jgi:hypothetical protein